MGAMWQQCVERAQPLDMAAVCKVLIVHGTCGEEAGQTHALLVSRGHMVVLFVDASSMYF